MVISQAEAELNRVRTLFAFNIRNPIKKRRINQYATRYDFQDGSYLQVYAPLGKLLARDPIHDTTTVTTGAFNV